MNAACVSCVGGTICGVLSTWLDDPVMGFDSCAPCAAESAISPIVWKEVAASVVAVGIVKHAAVVVIPVVIETVAAIAIVVAETIAAIAIGI